MCPTCGQAGVTRGLVNLHDPGIKVIEVISNGSKMTIKGIDYTEAVSLCFHCDGLGVSSALPQCDVCAGERQVMGICTANFHKASHPAICRDCGGPKLEPAETLIICPTCSGTGDAEWICPTCQKEGMIRRFVDLLDPEIKDNVVDVISNGDTRIEDGIVLTEVILRCDECNGFGIPSSTSVISKCEVCAGKCKVTGTCTAKYHKPSHPALCRDCGGTYKDAKTVKERCHHERLRNCEKCLSIPIKEYACPKCVEEWDSGPYDIKDCPTCSGTGTRETICGNPWHSDELDPGYVPSLLLL
jgi:RecJ-like exonuclease